MQSLDGEAKFWLEPEIELAKNYGLSGNDLRRIETLIAEREQEVRHAWITNFGS